MSAPEGKRRHPGLALNFFESALFWFTVGIPSQFLLRRHNTFHLRTLWIFPCFFS